MENICVPMHLDAFVLSPACCDPALASRIAPYTQPNYTALRLDSHLLQHDVLDNTDLHNTQPASKNPRTADIGSSNADNIKWNRMGVHLQWSLPRLYRTATADGSNTATDTPTPPVFRQLPNRWLIVRRLKNGPWPKGLDEYQSWVVESDAVQTIKNIPNDLDLESDMAPFVTYANNPTDPDVLNNQTEIFIGQKFDLDKYPPTKARTYLSGGLTATSSSNILFTDYALHNTNVLSVIDNFSYRENPNDQNVKHLPNAQCDYYVIGWHGDSSADPFRDNGKPLKDRLQSFMLSLDPKIMSKPMPKPPVKTDPSAARNAASVPAKPGNAQATDPAPTQLQDSTQGTRCLVHGAIYGVKYDSGKRPATSLVENAALKFGKGWKMEPVSMGTTPLDSVMAFLEAHKADTTDPSMSDIATSEFGEQGKTLVGHLIELAQLLYATGDDYDSRVQAQDLIAEQNFSKTDGGTRWTYASSNLGPGIQSSGKPDMPNPQQQIDLAILNEYQLRLDIASRKLKCLRWNLFAEWFKYKSEYIPPKSPRTNDYILAVKAILKSISVVRATVNSYQGKIDTQKSKVSNKQSTNPPFHQRNDPTLCIAGFDSGWPTNYLDNPLLARADSELTSDTTAADAIFAAGRSSGRSKSSNPVASDGNLANTAKKLLAECLEPSNASTDNGKLTSPSITGFQAWGDRNPFAPLFVEWECMYYHIDKKYWDVELRPSPVGHSHSQIRYAPSDLLVSSDPAKNKLNMLDNQQNYRRLSGRVPILPQPRFDLEAIVLQVLDSAKPADLPKDFDSTVIQSLKTNLSQLKFITAPLSGITNHLLTRCEGVHVKPNVRSQADLTTLSVAAIPDIGLYGPDLANIDGESALTPYGTLLAFGTDEYTHNPFKPVTHGQFIFTQLNIIDKFGQAISLPQRHLRKVVDPNPPDAAIHPCLSDYLTPNIVQATTPSGDVGILNTVFPAPNTVKKNEWPLCPYIQLTPAINQNARINGAFLVQDNLNAPWREVSEYESPIWGWIIINYADNGLQFFLGDGTFYSEIRRGGAAGSNLSAKWVPFDPPKTGGPTGFDSSKPSVAQLDNLISLFLDRLGGSSTYLEAFADMINGAIQGMPFPPSSYAGYANAIIGKPLALVNAGWSIELAEPPIDPQFHSIDQQRGDALWKDPKLLDYDFPLKIGDSERNYDGVVGFYKTVVPVAPPVPKGTSSIPAATTDWKTLFSYFPPDDQPRSSPNIFADATDTETFLSLKPFYINAEDIPDNDPKNAADLKMTAARALKYTVTTILMDPYTSIHGYSPILPTATLKISPWWIQDAMASMHAFFRLGPSLVVDDVPSTYSDANAVDANKQPVQTVKLPVSGTKGTWTWLQPYEQTTTDENGNKVDVYDPNGDVVGAQFAKMGVLQDVGTVKFEPAPYTFLEGYLQLMGRLDATTQQTTASTVPTDTAGVAKVVPTGGAAKTVLPVVPAKQTGPAKTGGSAKAVKTTGSSKTAGAAKPAASAKTLKTVKTTAGSSKTAGPSKKTTTTSKKP